MTIVSAFMPQQISSDATDMETIVSILAEDMDEVERLRKGKRKEDAPPTDEEIAVEAFAEELRTMLLIHRDQRMAQSLAKAVDTDRALIDEMQRTDDQVLQDRALAVGLDQGGGASLASRVTSRRTSRRTSIAGGTSWESQSVRSGKGSTFSRRNPIAGTSGQSQSVMSSEGTVSTSQAPDDRDHSPIVTRPASPSEPRRVAKPPESVYCAICRDTAEESDLLLPCAHTYHVDCAVQLFEAATKDESLLPPRCCRVPIPVELVTPHLSVTSAALFAEKLREHETSNRLYCPEASCSHFIGSAETERVDKQCPKCSTLVCAACKSFAHAQAVPCASDTGSREVLDLAESKGWKRCPGCSSMVELALGCYHMTCLCRTEFCYLCAVPWKNCPCVQWDEGRLITAAQHQVENRIEHDPRLRVAGRDRERLVRRVAEELRENHDCAHQNWTLRQGAARCENCHNRLANYILCCTACQMRACVRCQRNRL